MTYLAIALALSLAGLAIYLGIVNGKKKDAEARIAELEARIEGLRGELLEADKVIAREGKARRALENRCGSMERTIVEVAKNVPEVQANILNSLVTK